MTERHEGDEPRNGETRDDGEARRAREDAEWRAIVDNYGDRPEVAEPTPPPPEPEPRSLFPYDLPAAVAPELEAEGWAPDDDRYVPPPPPPVPTPRGLRLAAWLGVFGVPALVLLLIVLNVSLPSPLGLLAGAWFVGGFGYLVATMRGPDDPDGGWDNGAVV